MVTQGRIVKLRVGDDFYPAIVTQVLGTNVIDVVAFGAMFDENTTYYGKVIHSSMNLDGKAKVTWDWYVQAETKKSTVDMVREFNTTFGQPILTFPQIPTPDRVSFRDRFIKEELQEGMDAVAEMDIVKLADSLGDMQYVLDGFFLDAGMAEIKDDIVAEIHRSNMTKACNSEAELDDTLAKLRAENPTETFSYIQKSPNKWIVIRDSDGKVQKSMYYSKPNLKPIIEGRTKAVLVASKK